MARIDEKPIIREFLGEKVTQVLCVGSTEKWKHGVASVNGYIASNPQSITYTDLHIMLAECYGLYKDRSAIVMENGKTYFPIIVPIKYHKVFKDKLGLSSTLSLEAPDVFYIEGLRRPKIESFMPRLFNVFRSEYQGTTTIKDGRYVMVIENFSTNFLNNLLHLAKEGDGSAIDHTWISPFIDLIEQKEEKQKKKKEVAIPRRNPPKDTEGFSDNLAWVRKEATINTTIGSLKKALATKKVETFRNAFINTYNPSPWAIPEGPTPEAQSS